VGQLASDNKVRTIGFWFWFQGNNSALIRRFTVVSRRAVGRVRRELALVARNRIYSGCPRGLDERVVMHSHPEHLPSPTNIIMSEPATVPVTPASTKRPITEVVGADSSSRKHMRFGSGGAINETTVSLFAWYLVCTR
jgi:hypothetical protein